MHPLLTNLGYCAALREHLVDCRNGYEWVMGYEWVIVGWVRMGDSRVYMMPATARCYSRTERVFFFPIWALADSTACPVTATWIRTADL
jgi:hypothetical protein